MDYSHIAVRALANQDYPTARVASERLLATGDESRGENVFRLALAMNALGNEREANELLSLAAPLDKPGVPQAHILVARSMLDATNVTTLSVAAAETHLKYALAGDPNSVEAQEMLGRIYIQKREWALAKPFLIRLAASSPRALLLLSAVSKESGDEASARTWAERAVKVFRDRIETSKVDNAENRSGWVQALLLLEDYAQALRVLEDGRKQSGAGVYDWALSEVCAAWAQTLVKDTRTLPQRLRLVQQGLAYAPQNIKLLQFLVDMSHFKGEEGEQARAATARMMQEGGSAAILHFVLGSDAWEQGDTKTAEKHFALAFEMAPNLPAVANNMAAFLALGQKPDLPRGLAIVEALLQKYPHEAFFRDTRGQILVRMGRWSEGLKDLEYALPVLPDKSATHSAMAMAYRELGLMELAAEHERSARISTNAASRGKPADPAKR